MDTETRHQIPFRKKDYPPLSNGPPGSSVLWGSPQLKQKPSPKVMPPTRGGQ